MFTNCVEVGQVHKTPNSKFVFKILCQNGMKYIQIKEWFKRTNEAEWYPGTRGITLPLSQPELEGYSQTIYDDTLHMLLESKKVSDTVELDNPENYIYRKTREERRMKSEDLLRRKEARAEAFLEKDARKRKNVEEHFFSFLRKERQRVEEKVANDFLTYSEAKAKIRSSMTQGHSQETIDNLRTRIISKGCLVDRCYECGNKTEGTMYCSAECADKNKGGKYNEDWNNSNI